MARPLTAIITATCLNAHYAFLPLLRTFSLTFSPVPHFLRPDQISGLTLAAFVASPTSQIKITAFLEFQPLISHSNPPPGRREDSDDKGSLPERTTVTSILKFKPSAGDNLANIACEAQHPALQSRPLRASVKMFVQCKFCI